jgi:hypothetical protein
VRMNDECINPNDEGMANRAFGMLPHVSCAMKASESTKARHCPGVRWASSAFEPPTAHESSRGLEHSRTLARMLGALCFFVFSCASAREVEVLLVTGAPGAEEYAERFEKQASIWKEACVKASIAVTMIGKDEHDAEALEAALKKAAEKPTGQLWLVLIGHGTFDNREAKFNLRGPDITPRQLAQWCQPIQRELIFIHGGSCSAGFLQTLSGKNRIVITGTKTPAEIQYTRFGEFFAPAIAGDLAADLNQDKQVSLLEAFRHASKQAADFYEKEERIATEHALLDDDGDGIGTRSESFLITYSDLKEGKRASQIALVLSEDEKKLTDAQRHKRDDLERQLEILKAKRSATDEAIYYRDLESLLRELAAVYQ